MLGLMVYRWTGLCLLVAALGAFSLFLYGFFPLKYNSGKLSHMDDLPNFIDGVSIDGHQVYDSGENSVILMVIDGLRYDFVTEEHMEFTGQLLRNKSGCIYVSLAEPPTVTMPRIKSPERKKEKAQWRRTINFWRDIFAMMTGSVSTFADVALNFGAPAVQGDSVLRVAAARGRKSVLYGDDTWLRLFPGLWSEYDGTTSFYVSDYTEVDNNVTRHLDKVLSPDKDNKPSFDFLVLHYLGLDHIGHLEGAKSPKIKPKLKEMDDVVKKIYDAMKGWDRTGTLIVCGDHGMRDAGGHGGATPAEVLVPIVVIRSRDFECSHPAGPGPTVGQVDLAPTISWLLNAPPPADSAGRVLPGLLPADPRQHLYLLHVVAAQNARRSLPTDTELYRQLERAEKQFAHFLATGQRSAANIARDFYESAMDEMAVQLAGGATDFDMFAILAAIVTMHSITVSLACLTVFSFQPHDGRISFKHRRSTAGSVVAYLIVFTITTLALVTSCFISETKSQFCSFSGLWSIPLLVIAAILALTYFVVKVFLEKFSRSDLKLNSIDRLLIAGSVLHPISFFGTSFIEEEHMTWYFLWNTLMLFVLVRTMVLIVMYLGKKLSGATEVQDKAELAKSFSAGLDIVPKWVLLVALHRYLRTMNQTGDRWLFLPDTADWLNAAENKFYLELQLIIAMIVTLVICIYNVRFTNNVMQIHTAFTVLATFCVVLYRIATDAFPTPFPKMKSWDPVIIVDVFWGLLAAQFAFEILTYAGMFKSCLAEKSKTSNKFVYVKPKEKVEDIVYDPMEEPWNADEVKLNLARSVSHLMVNDLMLIVALLMRPHNVVMVPGIYLTCALAWRSVDHKLLAPRAGTDTEGADVLSRTLVFLWIGYVFFFYQGNSNSLASVDLGSGYVGLREYCPVRVALRMGLHAYAGPAVSGAALFAALAAGARDWRGYLRAVRIATNTLAFHRVYNIFVYSIVAGYFKDHLFVWTVFSPKLLYDFVSIVFSIQALTTIAQIEFLTHITNFLARKLTYTKI